MPLLTELGGFAGGIVAIDMALLTELDGFAGAIVAIDMPLLTELSLLLVGNDMHLAPVGGVAAAVGDQATGVEFRHPAAPLGAPCL